MFSQGMKSFINSTFIYSDVVISILMLTPLQKPQMCYLYCDTMIIHKELVIAERYSIHFGRVLFEQGPQSK